MTAENLLKTESNFFIDDYEEISGLMVKFARHHVEKALLTASENAKLERREYSKFYGKIEKTINMGQEVNLEGQIYLGIEEYSILNSYPLTNII